MDKKALGLRSYVTSIVLITLFSLCILVYSFGYINLTNPSSPIVTTDNRLSDSVTRLNGSINTFVATSSSLSDRLQTSEPSLVDYFLIFKDAFFIMIDIFKFLIGGIFIIGDVLFIFLGGGLFGWIITTIIYVITAILVIWALLLIIKSLRTGESER